MIDVDCWQAVAQAFSVIDHTKRPHDRSGDAFGELHVLLFGDFKQLPPATSKPPFIMLETVYKTFDFRVLRENRRQEKNPSYGKLLDCIKKGGGLAWDKVGAESYSGKIKD